jgi:hypothetical protein
MNMKKVKRIFCFLMIMVFSVALKAQQEGHSRKYCIAIAEGTTDGGVYGKIEEALVNTRKFTVVERNKINEIKRERKLQKSEEFIDATKIKDGAFEGIDYLLLYEKDGQTIQIKIVDINTATILDARSFVYENILSEIPIWIERFIPSRYNVLEVEGDFVVFDAGSIDDIKIEEVLDVVEVKKYGAKTGYEPVGEVKVTSILGVDMSKAKIKSGKSKIQNIVASSLMVKRRLQASAPVGNKRTANETKYVGNKMVRTEKPAQTCSGANMTWILGGSALALYLIYYYIEEY